MQRPSPASFAFVRRILSPRAARITLHATAVLAALVSTAGAAWADPSPALDRFSISAGGFYAEPRLQLNADTANGRVSTPAYDAEHVTIPHIKADLLLGDTQGLSLDYFNYDKSHSTSLSGATVINGQPVSGNAQINADMRLDVGQLAYKWWFGKGNDVFGLGVGAAYYHARLGGSVSGTVAGVTATGNSSVSENAFAPLLELGWRHAFSPDLRLYADASGIKKNGGNVNGHIYSGALGLEWYFAKNIGVGVDYGISKIHLNRDSDSADLDVRLTGPSAYLKARF